MESTTQQSLEPDDALEDIEAQIELAEKEDDLLAALSDLEDRILDDVVSRLGLEEIASANNSETPAVPRDSSQSFIELHSLSLPPVLCDFPSHDFEISGRIAKLIVLVAKHGHAKELWLSLETLLSTLDRSFDGKKAVLNPPAEGSDDIDIAALQLARVLLAIEIVIPRIRVRKPHTFVGNALKSLKGCLEGFLAAGDAITQNMQQFPAALLLNRVCKALTAVHNWLKLSQSDDEAKHLDRDLLLTAVLAFYPFVATTSEKSHEQMCSALKTTARTLRLDPSEELSNACCAPQDSPYETQAALPICSLFLLAFAVQQLHSPHLSYRNLATMLPSIFCGQISLLTQSMIINTLLQSLENGDMMQDGSEAMEGPRDDTEAMRALQALARYYDDIGALPPMKVGSPPPARQVIDLCHRIISQSHWSSLQQKRFLAIFLSDDRPHVRAIGIEVLRWVLLSQAQNEDAASTEALLGYQPLLLAYTAEPSQLDVRDQRTLQWLVALLNLVFVAASRTRGFRQPASAENLRTKLFEPISELLATAQSNEDDEDTTMTFQLSILKEALERADSRLSQLTTDGN